MGQMDVIVLGATGSIGRQTAAVIARHPERLRTLGLASRRDVDGMEELAHRLGPRWVVLTDREAAARLRVRMGRGVVVEAGREALVDRVGAAPPGTAVVAAMTGFAGLEPTLAAARAGHRVCLANKETLVAAGGLVTAAVAAGGGRLLPVDSEHSALLQCLGEPPRPYRRLILTCSGGPFRGWSRADLARVTVADALRHPTWQMGAKITVDSATLMNKGLEILEAHWLFGAPLDAIDVWVHPESLVHSLVEFADGALLAQVGRTDMRLPIQLALSWPERWETDDPPLALPAVGRLSFEEPDRKTFPLLDLARYAGRLGGTAPAVLNAANEVAVERFLEGAIRFLDIAALVEAVLAAHVPAPADSLEAVMEADRWARARAVAWGGP
jgi:1-deoxy-D-xylulose-5-phosphate reductoisomerase